MIPNLLVISKHSLSILYTNVRSILNKINEINTTASILDPDIICLVETWLYPNISSGILNLTGYNIIRKDRGSKGGGLLIAVKNYLQVDTSFL